MPLQIPDQSIALRAQAPDGMQSIAGMLNIASGAQALKKARATFDSDVSQRASDASTAASAATVNAANVQPLIDQQVAHTDQAQTSAKGAQFNLQSGMNDKINQILGGLSGDPAINSGDPKLMVPRLLDAKKQAIASGIPETMAEVGFAHMITNATTDPGGFPQLVKDRMLQGMQPTSQAAAITPSGVGVSNGQQSAVVNTNPLAAPVGSVVPGTAVDHVLPLGERQSMVTDQFGHSVLANKDPNTGQITSTAPVPGGNGGFQSLPQGETPDTLKQVQQIRTNANAAAMSAPDQQFNTNQIIKYANETDTGKAGSYLRGMKGAWAAVPWTTDSVTNYQLMGHAMAQQQGALAAQAGLNGSNAARDLAKEQTSDGEWTKDAIKSSARTSRALATGSQLYNEGVEANISNGGPFAARQFQNQWSQAANVDSLRLYDAVKNKPSDPEGVKNVVNSLGGVNSARYQFALKKIDQMKSILQGGH